MELNCTEIIRFPAHLTPLGQRSYLTHFPPRGPSAMTNTFQCVTVGFYYQQSVPFRVIHPGFTRAENTLNCIRENCKLIAKAQNLIQMYLYFSQM